MRKCDLCYAECVDSAVTHLNIYLTGSEGIRICFSCHKAVTDICKRIKEGTQRAINQIKQITNPE